VSMGEPIESWGERIGELLPFQVNAKLMKAPAIRGCGSCTACRPSTTGDQGGQADRRAVP
jgi:ornithine carbamoyltransferase